MPIAAETAYRALHEAGKIARGQTVLIHGAAGGVGSSAVQIAKAPGARVIGTASPNNHEFLRSLGVDQVIDYKSQKFEDVVKNVDLVLNTADADTNARSIGVVREGGALVSIVGPPDAGRLCRRENPLRAAGSGDRRLECRHAGARGRVGRCRQVQGVRRRTYSLADASKAWDKSREGHTRGKLIIRCRKARR